MIKTITYLSTLMQFAHELGQARLSGDSDKIEKAKKAHDSYKDLCLKSDEIICSLPAMRNLI